MPHGMKLLPLLIAASVFVMPVKATVLTEAQQTQLRLTVYNQDFAVVEDHRQLSALSAGQQVQVQNMSPAIMPETLRIQNAGQILEQGISRSSLNFQSLLQAYVGQTLNVARLNTSTGQETISNAELLSIDGSHALIRREGQIESIPLQTREWRFIFPAELPSNLQGRESIHFTSAGTDEDSTAILSYLTSGLGWKMDYVMTLDAQGKSLAVEGLASVYNHTGGHFNNAELRLMAGDINAPDQRQPVMMRAMAMSDSLGSMPEQAAESVQDFYLYQLPHPVSFQNNETKQLPLIQLTDIPAQVRYHHHFSVWPALDQQRHQAQADISLIFDAPKLADQNSPLPAGQARVFRPDRQGDMQFVGAANLGNLAAGETAELALGRAFDLNIQRRQTLFSDGFDSVTLQQEVTVTNSGNEGRSVDISVGFQQEWALRDATHPMKDDGAGKLTGQMHLPAGGSETLRFTVELKKRINR
jgi:hypothetical protein